MEWFQQLRAALADFYPAGSPPDVVGYLQGSNNPRVWRSMIEGGREQMLVLGSVPPTNEQWANAGVAQRGAVQTIRLGDLAPSYVITYGGFMVDRPWGKISFAAEALRDYSARTIPQFRSSLPKKSNAQQKSQLVAAMTDAISRIEAHYKSNLSDHKSQQGVITGSAGGFTGFWGYWTNHLFNSDCPPLQIWSECFTEVAHARSTLKEGKFGEAGRSIIRARYALLEATGIYYRWKAGIDGAGTQMQIAIGAAAIFAVLAAGAAALGSVAVAGAGATGATEATITLEGIASLISKADATMTRVVLTAAGGTTAPSAVAYEQALEEAAAATEEMLEMAAR